MRPEVKTYTSAGEKEPIPLDIYAQNFKVGFQLAVTGTSSSTLEITMSPDLDNATWFPHDTLATVTAPAQGNVVIPITAARLNIESFTSGSVELTVIQGG